MSQNIIATPATVKQEAFISRLFHEVANDKALNDAQRALLGQVKAAEVISKDDASYLISGLLKCDKKPRKPMAQPGYYIHKNGSYVVVVENKAKTATYAKVLDVKKDKGQRARAKWTYAPGIGTEVAHMSPMSLEQAAQFGHLNGVCFVCCRALTDPESVQRGIGPVCSKKFHR